MKPTPPQTPQQQQECHLDELGYCFVKKCIETIETRGLDDQGLYRIGGVNSRVARLLQMCLDRKNFNQTTGQVTMPDFSDSVEWETKTITSALKNYLRNLSEPLMTYNLHPSIIEAAKIENAEIRTNKIRSLIQQLPVVNFTLLKILVEHLKNVASHSQKNLMTISNLGICFAPTLMRGPEESASSIMEIKYSNVVANTLIEEYDSIFNDPKMNKPQQLYENSQQMRYNNALPNNNNNNNTNNNTNPFPMDNNHQHQEDRFGLELRDLQYQLPNSLSNNNNNKQPVIDCQNGTNDLAQFALKSYDHTTSRPTPTTTFISSSMLPIDIRPINDIKTYSFDQALMVPPEQPSYHIQRHQHYHLNTHQQQHQQQQQQQQQQHHLHNNLNAQHLSHHHHLGGSMNNSLNYIGYPGSQTSSHPNSLNYSSSSLNNGTLGDQYNNSNPMHSFPYYSSHSSKLPFRLTSAITLYACVADTESELSFGPNEIITDVRHSAEVGWLVGTLKRNGQRGLLPENYVKFI